VEGFVKGLFEKNTNLEAFKTHLRDFLVQLKEFNKDGADNSDLYSEERRRQMEEAKVGQSLLLRASVALPLIRKSRCAEKGGRPHLGGARSPVPGPDAVSDNRQSPPQDQDQDQDRPSLLHLSTSTPINKLFSVRSCRPPAVAVAGAYSMDVGLQSQSQPPPTMPAESFAAWLRSASIWDQGRGPGIALLFSALSFHLEFAQFRLLTSVLRHCNVRSLSAKQNPHFLTL
jgi:hypothetical protein